MTNSKMMCFPETFKKSSKRIRINFKTSLRRQPKKLLLVEMMELAQPKQALRIPQELMMKMSLYYKALK